MPIYFIREEDGPVKIGKTARVGLRLVGLQTGNPRALVILGVMLGGRGEEKALHRRFEAFHVRGEWFEYVEPVERFVRENAQPYDPAIHDCLEPIGRNAEAPTASREPLPPVACLVCAVLFAPGRKDAITCSPECRSERKRRLQAARYDRDPEAEKRRVTEARRRKREKFSRA